MMTKYQSDLKRVNSNGFYLRFIKRQTPELCMAAVQEDGWALQYVKEQTPEICLAAVKQCGVALGYVKEQTPEIVLAAIRQNIHAKQFIYIPLTPEIEDEIVLQSI